MVAALVIATGKTGRGHSLDPLKKVGTISAVQRVVIVLRRAGIERIVVVCGNEDDQKSVARMNTVGLIGWPNAQMFDNTRIGLMYLSGKCESVVIAHVGAPMFSVKTVRTLVEAKGPVCVRVPCYGNKKGNPILLRAEHFERILYYMGNGGMAGAIKASYLCRQLIDVDDEGVLIDISGGKDHRRPASFDLTELCPDARIRVVRERPFYGPGAHQLLQLTGEEGSLREACRLMGISYNKGRGIISLIEQQLGCPVIESKQGGKTGGHSSLTPKGEELVRNYAEFYSEAKQCLDELFLKHFRAFADEIDA